jgi:hypothetical protein
MEIVHSTISPFIWQGDPMQKWIATLANHKRLKTIVKKGVPIRALREWAVKNKHDDLVHYLESIDPRKQPMADNASGRGKPKKTRKAAAKAKGGSRVKRSKTKATSAKG